jgi:integrase
VDIGTQVTFNSQIQFENQNIIDEFLNARRVEANISKNTQQLRINTLRYLSRHSNKKFKDITREDIISFLSSLRKSENEDSNHKWIGTYNLYLVIIITFFKWFYNPKMEPNERPRPEILQNLKRLKRKEQSRYKPTDIWSQDDDLLFLKYCPSKRDRAYHTMSRDTSCRPSELLGLKIKDIVFRMAGHRQYAEILVNGKSGTRSIPLINCIPYIKDLLDSHPQKNNPNAYLMYSERVFGRRISEFGLFHMYKRYKTKVFPSLLNDPLLDPNDKDKISELLKKPWNPYIRRHSALTEKSKILKEHVLRQHAGWQPSSNMHQKYIHYYGNESNESILEAYGLIHTNEKEIDKLKPMLCPNCNEENKIDSKFCIKCRMILSYDTYVETTTQNERKDVRLKELSSRLDSMQDEVLRLSSAFSLLKKSSKEDIAKKLIEVGIVSADEDH